MIDKRKFFINRQGDGSWTIAPQPPLPAVTTFIANGWADVEFYRKKWEAIDWFPNSNDYRLFCEENGPPAFNREDLAEEHERLSDNGE